MAQNVFVHNGGEHKAPVIGKQDNDQFYVFKDQRLSMIRCRTKGIVPSDSLTLKHGPRHQNHRPSCFSYAKHLRFCKMAESIMYL